MDALLMALFEGVEKGFAKEAAKKKMYLAAAIVAQGGDSQLLSTWFHPGFLSGILFSAQPFVEWLQNAESESEEE
ncbi:unnamed protein product [Linum trigynum]|uniref:Uncharacterized protein n=1 Tax=Linum trigynum TaxID=586398 RepID=A0AAV2CT87_9ROSI